MKNRELAKIFGEIALFLEMEKVPFKPQAYQKVADYLGSLEKDVEQIYKEGGIKALEDIPGVGKNIARSIEEYIKTGKIKYYRDFKKKFPFDIQELISVEGLGPKKAATLYQKLKIKNVKDLEKAVKSHKIASLPGFGEKSEKNISEGIAFLKRNKGRFLLGDILPEVKKIIDQLKKLPEVGQISVAGSVRRMKETIGDVDILITAKNSKIVMDFFVSLPGVIKVWTKGATKSSVKLDKGFGVDLRVVRKNSYGSALQYFTGSKDHNIATRRLAMEKGLKLNEYGVFKGKRLIAGWDEKGVYSAIGLPWIEPELRENQGEAEVGLKKSLPQIIGYDSVKGDLHCHSDWDGGEDTIESIADSAIDLGYEYIGISDHTKFLRIEYGLNEKDLLEQRKEINRLNEKFKSQGLKFKILQGCEANIMLDGSIDIKDEALAKLDYVIAGIHSSFKMEKEKMTERMIRAMKNPNVDIISHPTGRILKKRDEYRIDFEKILKVAKQYKVALEINSCPDRLDLNDLNVKRAKEFGVKMAINADSHEKSQMKLIELGIAQARRGWAEREDIINCWPIKKLIKFFNK